MLSPNDFFVMCGRNTIAAGQVSAMANGVPITVAAGGEGNVQMVIGVEPSDWQLSRVHVWDYHLQDDAFYTVAAEMLAYVDGQFCPCGAGKYASGALECTECTAGTYAAAADATACAECAAGQFSATIGATHLSSCVTCAAGQFSTAGSSSCTSCDAGKFSATIGAMTDSSCVSCPADSNSLAGSVECACNAGKLPRLPLLQTSLFLGLQ